MEPSAEKDLLANFKNMSTSDQEELLVKLAQTYKTQSQGATAKEQNNTSSDEDTDEEEEESSDEQIVQPVDDFVPGYSEFPLMNQQTAEHLQKKFRLRYDCEVAILERTLQKKWVQLNFDVQTQNLIHNWLQEPWGESRCYVRGTLASWLGKYDGDGYMNMSRMYVLSTIAWQRLLRRSDKKGRMIDVGAGDGGCTLAAAHLFEEVVTTEASTPLAWRCWWKGFKNIKTMSLTKSGLCDRTYDVVTCFNVLDRTDDPWNLLNELKQCCKPDGLVVLACVFPFSPIVDIGTSGKRVPSNTFTTIPGYKDKKPYRFERCINSIVETVFKVAGFEVVRIAKVPYLSHGDTRCGLYTLDNAIFVLKPVRTNYVYK